MRADQWLDAVSLLSEIEPSLVKARAVQTGKRYSLMTSNPRRVNLER